MTAAGTKTCDGCDREGPAQQLEEVILPSGSMVVCPECRYHAEELAERTVTDCEGCGDRVTAATLSRTELPDGTEMVLCPDCRETVAGGERPAGVTAAAGESGTESTASANGSASASGTDPSATGAGASPSVSNTDSPGTTTAGASRTDSNADEAGPAGAQSGAATASTSSTSGETPGQAATNAGDAVTDGATTKPATTNNTCDQCGGLFSIELYQVVTVDGRTEQFCPDCKDDGLEEGIVRDVELRRAQAYEALGLEGSASSDDVRQAYLQQVKEVHPDRADGDRSEFMLVQQAYERLRDD
ncbi:J domain-containing protein [Salinarchaeum laminariae]|uniref:J domain-containing protein n=1 Tax=Salinarchaeum laminariae TaxID=869888 RepID=UPI0020BDF09C|nr:J domain-containing protein [Salinarchaeum laminariae]